MSSFKSYGKVSENEQADLSARLKIRKRISIISLSSFVLILVIVSSVLGTQLQSNGKSKSNNVDTNTNSISKSIKAICAVTLYPNSCYTSLSDASNSSRLDPEALFKLSIQVAMAGLSKAADHFSKYKIDGVFEPMATAALENCRDLLDLAMDHLNSALSSHIDATLLEIVDDLKTWLSAAGTYQQTCIDGLENASGEIKGIVSKFLTNSTEYTSNSLAIITGISNVADSFKLRRLMACSSSKLPKWVPKNYRKLVQTPVAKIKADGVVAKDGTGKYKTINAALNAVPEKSKKRFVIYVKKGVYYENVRVNKTKWNVMMVGDGMDATVVSGRLNFIDGTPTFSTATFAAFGVGFIARDMGFRNTAGPAKQQAVALMTSSDQSIFYRCRIDAFQDSLYTQSLRQFYRECNIYGTVDFIFGNGAAILQNCNILPKVPMPGQQNTITAQGKVDPNQNTGIVIQNSTIWPAGNLTSVSTYLGRPWKPYSTTLYLRSTMGSLIHPNGWLPWNGTDAPDTIFYSEFENFGPGSSTKNRVKWKGLKNITLNEASRFTVKSFINGDKWIYTASVTFKSGL
ncbi:hypothetical protein GIB67_009708 [Kingdonia uniflora]|uniref:Pectinesterase n=1 Tax=Kingdonia uniflora TaxID=39325 RepID=A0A7J7LB16_9MAGN|nr:hypothetical protein GIB67_009708 [Kingdonia uniflora]